jgi:hypothetical protein
MEKVWYSITLIIGLLLMGIALFFLRKSSQFIKNGYKTNAVVCELIETRDSKNKIIYRPVFKYTTENNKEIINTYNVASKPPMWNEGDIVEIIYNPNNPKEIKPYSYFGLYGICVIFSAIAMPFIVIGVGYFIFTINYQ